MVVFPSLYAAVIALIGWIIGTAVSALGLMLKANLDTAVNSSPFLSDIEKAQAMSLA